MYIFSIILLLFISCDEKTKSYIINPTETYITYKTNFKAENPGYEKYSLLLSWSNYPTQSNSPSINYNIVIEPTIINTSFSTYDTTINITNLSPGIFYSIIMQISPQLNDTLLSYTRPMTRPNWIITNDGSYGVFPSFDFTENSLEWNAISDIDIDSLSIYLYNSNNNYPNSTYENSWNKIVSLGPHFTQYTHQKESFNYNYCYLLVSSDSYGNSRKSYVACDYPPEAEAPFPININSVSTSFTDKIIISLNLYDESDFDSYILWRSNQNTMNNPDKIVESTNPNQLIIDDRENVIDKSYYYQVQTTNQYGISSFGNIVFGSTLP